MVVLGSARKTKETTTTTKNKPAPIIKLRVSYDSGISMEEEPKVVVNTSRIKHFLDTGQLHVRTHSDFDRTHRTFTSSSQA